MRGTLNPREFLRGATPDRQVDAIPAC
ncbi:unnamed protein product [Cuscuta europaea]|uniref:Uncharacterized protein n=1 Tax=Cuscuta europaea TaxID=41803 RepID=A0A9P0Z240_CUSEU|nr:unnamed protein product [Cuscuta europaea]